MESKSYIYNQVKLEASPGAAMPDDWQPEIGKILSYIKNGETKLVMLVNVQGDWQQQLLNHMQEAHSVTLTHGEMNDIRAIIYPNTLEPDQCIVQKDQLERWLAKIEASKKFQSEVETDIGWVVEAIHNLVKGVGDSPLKFAQQLMMGKLKTSELGLDVDRLQAIGAKYAPETVKKIQTSK